MEAAERTKNVRYAIRDIAVLAKQIAKKKKVISLNIGDPNKFDFRTPPHLISAVIENITFPLRMKSFTRVRMFIKACPVKISKPIFV